MDNCDLNPEFAVICSFISQFGDIIDLQLNIEQLKSSIEDQCQLDNGLIEIHIKLLKKVRRYFVRDQWEKALIRFASEYSYEDAVEIESLGYLKTRPSIKLNLLRRLLDAQFECDQKFKAAVNLCEANQLRLQPIGRDIKGNSYWHRKDDEGNFRIFLEQPLDYKYWKAICTKPEELNYLIEELDKSKEEKVKGEPINEPYNPLPEIFPEYFVKSEKQGEEKITIIDSTHFEKKPAKTKKASRGGVKKSSPLPILKETDEESNTIYNSSKNDTIIEHNGKENVINKDDDISQPIPSTTTKDQNSIESQVKTTIENLINRVASSLGNLIRPLTGSPAESIVQEKPIEQPKKPRKRQSKKEKFSEDNMPRRSSSRIQQLQQKKIAEQQEELKKIIESAENKRSNFVPSQDDDSRSQSTSSRNHRKRNGSPDDDFSNNNNNKKRRRKGQTSWKRGKGKKKLSWDKDDSDLSSTSSLTESEADELDDVETTFKYDDTNLDDEFACEEEDTNLEPVIVKRARTARQTVVNEEQGNLDNTVVEEDKPCERCDKSNNPEWILLCDMCDDGYHTSCCLPPLMIVPDGDWFCPPCEHKLLLTNLKEFYSSISELLEAKERERIKRQRLRQNFVKKEPVNEIKQEVLPEKRQRGFLNELNDPIAVQEFDEDMEATNSDYSQDERVGRYKPKKAAKSKKPARKLSNTETQNEFCMAHRKPRKTYSRRSIQESDESDIEEDTPSESSCSSQELKPKARRARASVSYRFQEYDELIKSAIKGDSFDEESSEEQESISNNSNYGRGKDMATIEALAYQQENGLANQDNAIPVEGTNIPQPKQKPRKKSRRLNDLDAVSETENATSDESFQASSATEAEEDDEDILTDAETEFDSDASTDELVSSKQPRSKKKRAKRTSYDSEDSEYYPTRTRRAASKRVSYAESTEDEDSSFTEAPKKAKKNVLSSDEESQASWKSSTQDSPIDNVDEGDEQSASCDASLDHGDVQNESLDELVETVVPPEGALPVVQPVPPQANTKANSIEQQSAETVPQQSFKKVRLERKEQVIMVHNTIKPGLNDSIDEIAAPLYHHQPIYHNIPIQPPLTYTSLDHGQPVLASGQLCHPNEKSRDPIQDLIQYCSDSANSATMFNSYTETLSTRSFVGSPAHPPFYGDEDLRPSSSSDNRKQA